MSYLLFELVPCLTDSFPVNCYEGLLLGTNSFIKFVKNTGLKATSFMELNLIMKKM